MIKYANSFKILLFAVIALQVALYFYGYLRPSIIFDYVDYFPVTIVPLAIFVLQLIKKINSQFSMFLNLFLIIIFLVFPISHIFKAEYLTTYSYPSKIENSELDMNSEYLLAIDLNGSIELNFFDGFGYFIDVLNKPGKIGYPEVVETLIGEPKVVFLRELETTNLLQVSGWKVLIGNQHNWKLKIFSFDSNYILDNSRLSNSEISGTGEIYLGSNLNMEELMINGNYEITIANDLPVVVIGIANVPSNWINATIGYLNQTNEVYKVKIIVSDGSNVNFYNEG